MKHNNDMDKNNDFSLATDEPVVGIVGGTAIRPQRNRSRPQDAWEEGARTGKKPERKKTNGQRRAPSRGRYIDEYARPAF
jgi:hypothetical protein